MTEAEVIARLTKVFREVLDDETLTLTAATRPVDVPGWDSMAFVNIVVGAEAELGIEFTTAEVDGIKTVGDLAKAALSKRPK